MQSSNSIWSSLWKERQTGKNCDIVLIMNAKKEYAHSFVLKEACEFFALESLPVQNIDGKEISVVNMDKFLEADSLANFEQLQKSEALNMILQFLYEQKVKLEANHAQIILVLSQMLVCRAAFKWACKFLAGVVSELSQAITVYNLLKLHTQKFVSDSFILLDACKAGVASDVAKGFSQENDQYKELLDLPREQLKEISERVKFPKAVVKNMLTLDDSEFSKSLLKLDVDLLSAWWVKESFKKYPDEKAKYLFIVEWVKHDPKDRVDVVHILLRELDWSNTDLLTTVAKNPQETIFSNLHFFCGVLRSYAQTPGSRPIAMQASTEDKLKQVLSLPRPWNLLHAGHNVQVSPQDPCTAILPGGGTTHKGIMSEVGYSVGCHVFRVSWPTNQRECWPMIGVAEKTADMNSYIGATGDSCGWKINYCAIYNNGGHVKYYPRENYPIPEQFCLVLDCTRGVLGFSLVHGEYLGDCFTGLTGRTLHVACSSQLKAEVTLNYMGSV